MKRPAKFSAYDSVHTCMMDVWRDIHSTGNLSLLIKEGNATEAQLFEAWNKLDESFINEFGISESRRNYLLKVKALVMAMREAILSDSPLARTTAKIKEKEIEDLFREQKSAEIGLVISQVKKFMQQSINLKTTSIYEFYNDYNYMISQHGKG